MRKLALLMFFSFLAQTSFSQAVLTESPKTELVNVRATEFNQLLEKETRPQLIDIRTPREYQMGHIDGAINVNFYSPLFKESIKKKILDGKLDTNRTLFIYCRSGSRSNRSLAIFKSLGFKKIIHLVYGINDWYRNQLPIKN